MDQELLKQFFQQENMRIEVYKHFKSVMDRVALERVYKGEDIGGIKDAKEIMAKAETELYNLFTPKKKTQDSRRAE